MTRFEILTIVFSSIALILSVGGLFFTAIQLKLSRYQLDNLVKSLDQTRKANIGMHDWNRRVEALKALDVAKDPNQSKDLEILEKKLNYFDRKDPIPIDEIKTITKGREKLDLKEIIRRRLNTFELYCIGINQGIYDEEVIKNACKNSIISAYDTCKFFIEERRKINDDAYVNIVKYYHKWNNEDNKTIVRNKTG